MINANIIKDPSINSFNLFYLLFKSLRRLNKLSKTRIIPFIDIGNDYNSGIINKLI